jgi:hypothetical protein
VILLSTVIDRRVRVKVKWRKMSYERPLDGSKTQENRKEKDNNTPLA